MGTYPDYKTYRALYARYHQRGVEKLLHLLRPLDGMGVVDLCGGDGRLTSRMLASGAESVLFVDAEPAMIPPMIRRHKRVHVEMTEVRTALSDALARGDRFDRIVCQQAVNYWLDKDTAASVARLLRPGGIFAFNTFNQCPPEIPRILQYELDGHAFVEVSWLVGADVHHLQVRDGMEPHHTVFQWLSPEHLYTLLAPHFFVYEEGDEKTSLYRCERKEESHS